MFVRRYFVDLEAVIARSKELFYLLNAVWNENKSTWTFKNGATLRFRHLKDADAAQHYQGHDYTWVCFEELTQWPDDRADNLMRGAMRSGRGAPIYLRSTGNPGGPGHNWVKAHFISPAPIGLKILTHPETGQRRVFIPSRLEDNLALVRNDPEYEMRLRMVGNEKLVKAWREGNWDIVAGGFFDDVFSPSRHILKPFKVPDTWKRRRSFDWGSSRPASLGQWAVSDGTPVQTRAFGELYFPRGSLIRTDEWYTAKTDGNGSPVPNVGLQLTNEQLGEVLRSAQRASVGPVALPILRYGPSKAGRRSTARFRKGGSCC